MRAPYALVISLLVVLQPFAFAQDPSYALTPAAAEKFVRATQQLVASGTAPNVGGNVNPGNLSNLKAALDANPAAQQALAAAGLTSNEYVSFMAAAMTAMMVGQMEAAGVRGVDGEFEADAPVEIVGEEGEPFAKGLSRYSSRQLRNVMGRRTSDLPEGLPHEAVHRDDLVVLP